MKRLTAIAAATCVLAGVAMNLPAARASADTPVEYGIDRSNMHLQWTLAWPQQPETSPFLKSEYFERGNFQARRVAVMDGIARAQAPWFRDNYVDTESTIDLVKMVHARDMKMLAIVNAFPSEYLPGAHVSKEQSGCGSGAYRLSKLDFAAYQRRLETSFAAMRAAGETIEAFQIGNELDLYCNNADNPTAADWARHQWKWFLTDNQVQTWVSGYAPFLAASVTAIRKYFPDAQIITFGNSMPGSAPLIGALVNVRGADGRITDYTDLVDGYGTHLYPSAVTTSSMVKEATEILRHVGSQFPHNEEKPIWITEWNPAMSSWWNNQPWYFQYDENGRPGGELNKADAQGIYPAMNRAGAVRTFNRDVIDRLRTSPDDPVNVSHVFYYAYDSGEPSPKCEHVRYSWRTNLRPGMCIDGMIDPSTGNLLPGMVAAVTGR